MRFILFFILLIPTQLFSQNENNQYVRLSQQFLRAIMANENAEDLLMKYQSIDLNKLASQLNNDRLKKAFWINTYNAFIQYQLGEEASLFDDRNAFFKSESILIGGLSFSFDFIEHGIIRASKVKLSFGYLNDPFASEIEKKLRTEKTDGRIHFALNCGAKSCPKIAIYSSNNINEELDLISKQFLSHTSVFNKATNTVSVSTLFSWFRADFNDKDGVLGYLMYYEIIPPRSKPKVIYQDYDWTLELGNFTELN